MRMSVLLGSAAILGTLSAASADPVGLDAYVDANGFIDVQTLTCAQLANTYQEDADALSAALLAARRARQDPARQAEEAAALAGMAAAGFRAWDLRTAGNDTGEAA